MVEYTSATGRHIESDKLVLTLKAYIANPLGIFSGLTILIYIQLNTELILGLRPTNERRRYFVTTSLIGWAQT